MDHGDPIPCESKRNATVNIKVFRNLNPPVFSEEGLYKVTINENHGINNRVTQVRAQDKDKKVTKEVFI